MRYDAYNKLTEILFPVGKKCISITPNSGVIICEVVGHHELSMEKKLFPYFKSLDDPEMEEFYSFGDLFEWSQELEDFIRNNKSKDIDLLLRSQIRH